MKFSIVIAAYNVASYIDEAIESCVNQKGIAKDEYEIIIIDDGSKDNTGEIIDQYKDEVNVRIVHQQNSGLSKTRNFGLEISKGEFLLYLDGDDWLLPNTLSSLEEKSTAVDLIVFPMTYWFSLNDERVNSFGLKENTIYTSEAFLRETIGYQKLNIIPAPCKCYRKSVLLDNNQRFIENILHEDNPYFADTMKNFQRIIYIDKGFYVYRQQRVGSITSTHTIHNFKGAIEGNKHILKAWGCKNKYINYMISSINIFQVILEYNKPSDVNVVMSHYRAFNEKWIAIRQLFNFPFMPKAIIRHILFILDPWILLKFMKCYYGK